MKQILFSLLILAWISSNLSPLNAQFYFPDESEISVKMPDDLYVDVTTPNTDWVTKNTSVLEEKDRLESIEKHRTLSVNPFLSDDFCWRESYGRGVGSVPDVCPNGMELQAGLCYKKCASGYHGVGPVCWKYCPPGFRDDGAYCAKPAAYGRGAGYAAWDFWRCEKKYGRGNCEWWGAVVYPKCKPDFHPAGCCVCSPNCPPGYNDIGVSCAKPSYGRGVGVVPNACSGGREYDAGLCYSRCRSGFEGVGPVCWENTCPSGWVNCGAGCAESEMACGLAITDMVLGPLQVVLNVVSFGAAGGVSGAINGAKASALATKYGATSAIGGVAAAAKGTSAVVAAGTVTSSILIEAAEQGLEIVGESREKVEQFSDMVVDAERTNPEFDWKELLAAEPTGLASCVLAFVKPMCTEIKQGQATSGALVNVARGKITRQSSTYGGAAASRVVDGNTNGQWAGHSVSHTNGDNGAWIEIDLGRSYNISEIKLYNRTDCCSERANGLNILVSNNQFTGNHGGTTFASNINFSGASKNIKGNANGRFVRLYLTKISYLHLAEVEVMGR